MTMLVESDLSESLRELVKVAREPLLVVECGSRRIVEANPAACALYGMNADELVGSDFGERFSEARFVADILERHRDYVPLRFHSGRSRKHFPVEISVRYFAVDSVEYAAMSLRDISDRLERERIDNQGEQKYKILFEASPYPILILNSHGMVVDANRCAQHYYGYEHDELIRLDWQAIARDSAATQFSARPTMIVAHEHWRKDGSRFMAEVMLNYFRLRGQTMILALVRDVTEHWRTMRQLQDSEARWRFAIEGSGDAIVDWPLSPEGPGFVSAGLNGMLGYPGDDDQHLEAETAWLSRVHPDDRPALDAAVKAHIDGLEPLIQCEHRLQESSGAYRWFSLRAKLIRDGRQQVHLIGAIRDIHQSRQRALQEIADRSKMFRLERMATAGEMLSALAHEVNQPLTAISNYSSLAIRQFGQNAGPEKIGRSLTVISEQALRAGEIVRRIREFVRRGEPNFVRTSLNGLISRVSGWCKNEASAAGVQIRLELDLSLQEVEIDILQIEQVLFNLVRNGIEAMHPPECEPRTLIVCSEGSSENVQVSVRDHGVGIAEAVLGNMFEPFVSSKAEGMGMGLAICQTIIEAHGGLICAQAVTEGKGTIFTFVLPIRRALASETMGEKNAGN